MENLILRHLNQDRLKALITRFWALGLKIGLNLSLKEDCTLHRLRFI